MISPSRHFNDVLILKKIYSVFKNINHIDSFILVKHFFFFTVPGLEWKCHYWASAITDLAVFAKLGENSAGGQVSCPSY